MVFQSYALFPHPSVAENIVFGLRVRKVPAAERATRLTRVAEMLGLRELLQTRFMPTAPLTLENFVKAWAAAPFARYFLNTVLLVTMILGAQLVLHARGRPLLIAFLLFQRQFVQSFMRAGIRLGLCLAPTLPGPSASPQGAMSQSRIRGFSSRG